MSTRHLKPRLRATTRIWENSSCDTEFSMSGSHGKAGKVVENDDKNQ